MRYYTKEWLFWWALGVLPSFIFHDGFFCWTGICFLLWRLKDIEWKKRFGYNTALIQGGIIYDMFHSQKAERRRLERLQHKIEMKMQEELEEREAKRKEW